MSEPLRVVLVEDSPTDAKLVMNALAAAGRPIEYVRVEEATALRETLGTGSWDVVLSDWSMPRFSALGALEVVKQSGLDLPFIIVSGTIGEEAAADAMRAGAHDYIFKDRLVRLVPAVEREVRDRDERAARRVAEAALRASEARFRRLWDSGIVGISWGDVHGRLHDANEAFLRMVGYSHEDLRAGEIDWERMTPPEWKDANERALEQLRSRGVAPPWEKEFLRKDGSRVPVLVGVAMLDAPECIAFTADLRERKRAEATLRDTEQQLRHSQKMEAVGRLAGGVAHDFNNMLSVILSYCDLVLADLKKGDPIRGDVEEMRSAGTRAADLTRQLLMFSRQQVVNPKVLDVNQLLSGMEKMLRRLVGEDVALGAIAAPSLGHVRADPGSLEQVVMNLVVNARDAMPDGGTLTLETRNVTLDEEYARGHMGVTPGPYVRLTVTDTGVGMDKATMARIFEPFFTTKEVGKGTGLGLSTVFGIVQQSGGHLWVDSEPGRGTTFDVHLPRVDAALPEPRRERKPSSLRGTETILLVEDEEQVREVVRGILLRHGYTVVDARNAGEALLHCERHPGTIHLLLTDVVMPQMGGPELARRLLQARAGMKVLCMSGYADDAALRSGALMAGFAYLHKPITVESLTTKVRDVLDTPCGSTDG